MPLPAIYSTAGDGVYGVVRRSSSICCGLVLQLCKVLHAAVFLQMVLLSVVTCRMQMTEGLLRSLDSKDPPSWPDKNSQMAISRGASLPASDVELPE